MTAALVARKEIMSLASDPDFFEHELAVTLDGLYGAALRLTRNPDDAQDLVAETVAKAWARFDSLHDRQCFRAWIFRILTNTFISDWRKQASSPEQPAADEDRETDDESFSLFEQLHQPFLLWWGNPEQEFLNKLLREHLEQAINALPEAFRVVIVLAELQGFTYREIADMLQLPLGTVRSRLSRGRGLLQKALWEDAREMGLSRNLNHPE
ncbi:MAG: sigma-70 family RNA polymerase sigma factor [Burkholderiales bacterium]